ncbi:MAG: GvpL/GvpF family gas vesicle protein [Pseudomonadota bacterium]
MIYLYGVAHKANADQLPNAGVFGGVAECLPVSGLTIVAERVEAVILDKMLGEGAREDDTIMHNAVMAHQGFLNQVAGKVDVLPFRFGTAVESEAALEQFLADQRAALDAALDTISGHLEWGVKIVRSEAARKPVAPAGPASGADYLRQLSAKKQTEDRSRESMSALCKAVANDLAVIATKVQPLSLRSSDNSEARLLNIACLLPRGNDALVSDTINQAVERFEDLPLRIEISGPWPPFSFVSITEDGEV